MSEIAFEALGVGLEATRGTLIDPPTHLLPWPGTIRPVSTYYEPDESRGTLFRRYRQKLVKRHCEWDAEGGADPRYAPLVFNMITGAGVISTPTNGVSTRLHTHKPTGTSDAVKTASIWWGDPNIQLWSAPFGFINEWTITADGSGDDGATMSISGLANYWAEDSATLPATLTTGSLLMPSAIQVWIDTSSAIGTTAITGRVISAEITGNNNIVTKPLAVGPGVVPTYSRIGRGKPEVSSTVTMEIPDTTQLDLVDAATDVKMRVRISGDLIESVTPDYYQYLQWDVFGKLKFDSWGDLEGTNRTVVLRVDTIYNSTLGADFALYAQNTSATV